MKNKQEHLSGLESPFITHAINSNRFYRSQQERHEDEDHELKKDFARYLRALLLLQTGFIFVAIFLQGFRTAGFKLNNYIFYILISGTLIESYFLVKIVVNHLFPKKDTSQEKQDEK